MPYAAGLAAVLTLAGCAVGVAEPAPRATTAVTPAPVTSSATTSSAPTTAAGPAFPAGLPEAAKKQTDDGAKAFVKHFIAELNAAWRDPDPGRIERLCEPASRSCASFVETARKLVVEEQRYSTDAVRIDSLTSLSPAQGQHRVDFRGGQTGAAIVTRTGDVVQAEKRSKTHNMFYLEWGGNGWLVAALKGVE